MKITKSYKIVLLLTALILVVSSMFCSLFLAPSSADESANANNASNYFGGLADDQIKFDGGYMVATVKEDSTTAEETVDGETVNVDKGVLTFDNKLAVNDLAMSLVIPTELKSTTLVVKNSAYYANGNIVAEKVEDEYVQKVETIVTNEIEFDFVNNKATVNGKTSVDFTMDEGKLVVKTAIDANNYLEFTVGATEAKIVAEDVMDGETLVASKKIKSVDGVSPADISVKFALKAEGTTAQFKIESIDQKASDAEGNYKQTFETDEKGTLTDSAYPIVAISEDFYKKNDDGSYSVVKNLMTKYTLSVSAYSVLGKITAKDLCISDDVDNIWITTEDAPKSLIFKKEGSFNVNIVSKDTNAIYKTIAVKVTNFTNDNVKPYYVYNEEAFNAYMVALKGAYYNAEDSHYTALGTSMTVPSLKDLVFDDIQSYENMNKTVYYDTNTKEDLSSSGMTISLSEAGKYVFNVSFNDKNGNSMDKEKDFEQGKPGEKFIFTFDIVDDAPIVVESAPVQGNGCVDVKYTASKFDIDAVGCKTTYKLYYKANENAEEVEIPKASSIVDKDYDKDGYTYEDIKAIGYDGSLTFTPNAKGIYKIECVAVSSVTSRADSAFTEITVDREPSAVKVYTDWIANNVWSVVFLSIGTLCLIGIIVLLCIKPKEDLE